MRAISKPVLYAIGLVLVIAVVAGVALSRRPAEVAVLEIRPRTVEQALSVVGRARSAQLVQVSSPNPGQVTRLFQDEGDRVAAGAPLAVILAAVEQAQTEADVARLRAAEAEAREARLSHQRTRTLYERGF
ncbi:MAG TPA: efflux RND transporter periplasmic adaptor subunit, partial [Brevundimonas sp.]|nr:efflux RND transporter periplasmic adaptor subunit [Brevundimonas sp.]